MKKAAPKKKISAQTGGAADDRLSPEEIRARYEVEGAAPYQLLDSGNGRKLEQVGPYRFDRQCPVAFWSPGASASEWKRIDAYHKRTETGGGFWEKPAGAKTALPAFWFTKVGRLIFKTKPTAFGHLGFFAEQADQWDWFRDSVHRLKLATDAPAEARPRILNLFAYTGGSSIACALGGALVTHVDAARGVVDWARQNATLNGVPEGRIRYVIEDCLVFLEREARRGSLYDGLIMDPPSYGRGPNKEVFKLEDDAQKLLGAVARVLKPKPLLFHFSCHTPGFTPRALERLSLDTLELDSTGYEISSGEMTVTEVRARPVPSGFFVRIRRS